MKNKNLKIAVFALISILFAVSCERTDFDELRNLQEEQKVPLADHEARIKVLEDMVHAANTDIINIKKLIEGLQKKVSIVSYEALEDGSGYVLTMSDGTKMTLKNGKNGKDGADGKDGQSSTVNVKKDKDGKYYWTLNGNWLLDADGNKIPVTGEDGKERHYTTTSYQF